MLDNDPPYSPQNCSNARGILSRGRSYGTANAPLGPRPCRRDRAMDSQHPLGVAYDCRPPAGFAWTSHNLRKGAASAIYAIGARLTYIRYAGGWSTNSTVLEAKYINFTMSPSLATWIFFGYLYRGTPRGDS